MTLDRAIGPATVLDGWRRRVSDAPDRPALAYFDSVLTAREADEASDALAAAMIDRGVTRGDRVGIYLQNIPQYPLTFLALWKIGAVVLILNPMYRNRELRTLIDDAEPIALVCDEHDLEALGSTLRGSTVRLFVSTSGLDLQARNDPRVFSSTSRMTPRPDDDLMGLIDLYRGRTVPEFAPHPDDLALLAYTSGTTGPPKGAQISHANAFATALDFGEQAGLADGDVVFAVAPLFHITGAMLDAAVALIRDCVLVFAHRFHAAVTLDAFVEHRVTYTIGSITVFNAISETEGATRAHFESVKALYSGGAPIPPATVTAFESAFGCYIHNAYGMTETTAGVIAVPPGTRAPVDSASGSLSVGLPLPRVTLRTLDSSGEPTAAGIAGELEISGPQVVSGYWRNPDATASTMPEGRLRTGDVAIIDDGGWVYLVDRLKDQINVSGYKVWPREVEDTLYEHPAVFEAAVVGRPDDYQGESVVAYVSLRNGTTVTPDALVDFARDRLAAYKRPKVIHIIDELPKTQTGKIRRAALKPVPVQTHSTESDTP
ncbi:AMP-binding protein [Rhodococcus sp. IEGM 1401]|uniref:class I adenylate-forming enzyme family protein n=1 Tax=unclassified Rhodococcus (in: high G+C Gram-positive bacteria) TaxID=192944 RepID=UPI0022B5CA99|nr:MULTISPECIES: AMP-binding protein [unclassified Rhodococcus (in: high G+C Gram-positive bacteria)]MCZ4560495.1 AMP-binding protein [Rhodococcus sp. IEGM 1401]MDI9920623.1 AMP-binding protein [Rhodococcus sp. IEGM 1372]MDV8033341.1 AMP-binding protein [Rhodococcus sp. IEGM 1414]